MELCKKCGSCCQNVLVISDKEIQTIKKYIKEHDITPINRSNVLVGYQNICPFLDDNKRCMIFEVRPEICRRFYCSQIGNNPREFSYLNKQVVNMTTTFLPGSYNPCTTNIDQFNKMYKQLNKEIQKRGKRNK